MKIRSALIAVLVAGCVAAPTIPALAMGTGNPYQDAQTGLNYVVYQPSFLVGLSLKGFGLSSCGEGRDESIAVQYGSGKKFISLTESSIKNICPMNMMLVRGASRTVVNKPGAGNLVGTQVVTISVGIPRAQIKLFFSHLIPRYTVPGSKSVAPVLVDPTVVTYASVPLSNFLVFTVSDPEKWSATIADPTIVSFIPSSNMGYYTTNPWLKPLKKGTTIVGLNHNGTMIVFTITVN